MVSRKVHVLIADSTGARGDSWGAMSYIRIHTTAWLLLKLASIRVHACLNNGITQLGPCLQKVRYEHVLDRPWSMNCACVTVQLAAHA